MLSINMNNPALGTRNFLYERNFQRNSATNLEAVGLIEKRENISLAPDTRPNDFLSPLHSFTRINGHSIPRFNPQMYRPEFTPEHCTAHLSHEEWWASLDLEIKLAIDSLNNVPGTGQHIAHLDSEGRFHHVNSVKEHIRMREHDDRLHEALSEMAESMGMKLSSTTWQSYPLNFAMALFECPNGERNSMIVTILEDGRKIFTKVSEGFTVRDFTEFAGKTLVELLEKHGLNNADVSASRLKSFFEDTFEKLFGGISYDN